MTGFLRALPAGLLEEGVLRSGSVSMFSSLSYFWVLLVRELSVSKFLSMEA